VADLPAKAVPQRDGGAFGRGQGEPARRKRFYTHVGLEPQGRGLCLVLDGKPALTPRRERLMAPRERIAHALVSEWEGQQDMIEPGTMPVTRLANSAIDGVAHEVAEVRRTILAYAETDLLYYRASEPQGLVSRQAEAWSPVVAWAEQALGARFVVTSGVVHVAQPAGTLAALARAIDRFDEPFALAGLHLATTLTDSVLLALALAHGAIDAEAAWTAAHVDEDWNISQWGEDAEAKARRAARHADFLAAVLALADDLP